MRAVHTAPALGFAGQVGLLAVLQAAVGLSGAGWAVGLATGAVVACALSRGLAGRAADHAGGDRLGPADRVTLTRATLVGGVAALTVVRPTPVALLVCLSAVALALDAVDGWVARRTGTATPLGARFDMEVDAYLILVLSVDVARTFGAWVLLIGAARYVFVGAGWLFPWLRATVPARYWSKVVAAVQGVVLTVAAAGLLPPPVVTVALVVALALLTESFGRDVLWLWRHRARDLGDRGRVPRPAPGLVTAASAVLVWFVLVAPDRTGGFTAVSLLRLPLEGLVLVALLLLLPFRWARVVAVTSGAALGLLTILKVFDAGFTEALGRPFNPVLDWSYLRPAVGVLSDSVGGPAAVGSVAVAALACLLLLVGLPLAVLRLSRVVTDHRASSARAVSALAVVWALCALLGVQVGASAPVASTSAAGLAYGQLDQTRLALADKEAFSKAAAVDAYALTPGDQLLTGLRGKDVIIAFVESYGRVAVQGSDIAPQVDAVLDEGTRQLRAAGFASQSAFLTSPTFGGISWLAHSSLQSGLWVDNQRRYDSLVAGSRTTLSGAFKRAGWRTVADVPSNEKDWPEGRTFYGYDTIYDAGNVGYAGPSFSYATMPDQYVLAAFDRLELAKTDRPPVMAEIDLVSSHTPWAPLPRMVGWNAVGDGTVFDPMPAQGASPEEVWRDADAVRAAYGQSVAYSLSALLSFVQTSHDDNLVLVVLGDHQPATIVSGEGASHDVPISIIARDPAVMDRIVGWGWQAGLRPGAGAPVWPMDAFRDRFLAAYGPASSG